MSASLFFGIATSHVQFCVLVCASFSKIFNQEHDRIVVKIESYGSRWMKAWERSSEIKDTLTLVLLPWPGPLKPSPAGLSHVYFGFIWESKRHLSLSTSEPIAWNLLETMLTARPLVDHGHLGFACSAKNHPRARWPKNGAMEKKKKRCLDQNL